MLLYCPVRTWATLDMETALCTTTDGTAANIKDCKCGTADCDASTGHFCSLSINACYRAPCAKLLLSAAKSGQVSIRFINNHALVISTYTTLIFVVVNFFGLKLIF